MVRIYGRVALAGLLVAAVFASVPSFAHDATNDQLIPGGGRADTDCMAQFFGGDLNEPADKPPRWWRCYDGEESCDQGPAGDGKCLFGVGVCLNGTNHPECTPTDVASVEVKNWPVDDPRFDPGLAALQSNIRSIGLPTAGENLCTSSTAPIEVPIRPTGNPGRKKVRLKTSSSSNPLTGRVVKDIDRLRLMCAQCPAGGTFDNIAKFIFAGSCATSSCHSGPAPAGGLNLGAASAYASLVGATPQNLSAAAAGMKRVDPGNPGNSFILDKLCGQDPGDPALRPAVCAGHDLVAAEGGPMPPPTGGLSEAKIKLLYDWILAGAPETGWIPDTHCGVPRDIFEPAEPPPVPPGGFQIELPPFDLAPGQEIEGCYWMELPITQPMAVGKWEIVMNQGSHHFILFRYVSGDQPVLNTWQPQNIACLTGSLFNSNSFQEPLTASQDPVFIDEYPTGVARMLYPGDIVGLNSHYINTLNIPIQGRVFVNVYPYSGPQPAKEAEGIYAVEANYGSTGIGFFGPGIPPFTSGTTTANWTNPYWPGACVFMITSHMHKRGTYFTAQYPIGTEIYASSDWDHPELKKFNPPMWVPYGQKIRYTCWHDNGATNPNAVYRDPATGQPAALKFGFSAEQEMCIMPGLLFVPSVAGNCTLP